MALPKNTVAVTPGGPVKESMIAGYITMFSVPDVSVSTTKITRTFAQLDLDTDLLPPGRRAVHVFQGACRSVEDRRRANGSERGAEIVVDELMETPSDCVYQITRRIRDRENRLIDHPKAMRVTFAKGTETMTFEPLEASHYAALSGLEDAIRDWYDKNATKVPAQKVRYVLRAYMDLLGGINLRRKSGGVYFVPARARETLEAIREALKLLYGDEADLHMIPCVNDEGAREMVRKHFTINAVEQVDELMAKIAEVLNGRTSEGVVRTRAVRSQFMGNVVEKRRSLAGLTHEYRDILQTELTDIDSKLEDLDEQIDALSEAVSVE